MPKKFKALKKLEKRVVRQSVEEPSQNEIEDIEHEIDEKGPWTREGLEIEEEEKAGEEPYLEYEKLEKDPDEEEEEE